MLAKLLYGYKATQCLYVAAKLNIADYIEFESKSIDELAKLSQTHQNSLYRVMRCLASLGVFVETEGQIFSLNEHAKALLSNSENTLKDFIILCGEELYQAAGELLYTTRKGSPAFNHIYNMSHWEYLNNHPEKAELFHTAFEKGSGSIIREIIRHYDFSNCKNIVDLGGGKGHLLGEILLQYSNAQGIVFDLLNAQHVSNEYIAQNNLTKRCHFEVGNFFIEVPATADAYLLKVVLHDWDDKSASIVLQKCKESMTTKSKLLIIEKVIEEDSYKDLACLGDINMMVMYSGKERTVDEFKELFKNTGLKFIRQIKTSTVFSIIEAEKA